jgi:hypothetical protein
MTTDTPRTDACPHCGAEEFELPVEGYRCGTEPWYDEDIGSCLVRSNICYANQNSQLKAEVERLKKELDAWDYGTRAKREQEARKKAEAEVESLREKLDTAIEIAKDALWYARIYENEIHFNKMDGLYQKLVALKNK